LGRDAAVIRPPTWLEEKALSEHRRVGCGLWRFEAPRQWRKCATGEFQKKPGIALAKKLTTFTGQKREIPCRMSAKIN